MSTYTNTTPSPKTENTFLLKKPQILPLSIMLLLSFSSINWGYSGGIGTLHIPYEIASPEDLITLGQTIEDYDKHYIITHDIDLSGYTFDQAPIAGFHEKRHNFQTFDYYGFGGTINGNGHVIRNLTISGTNNLGLIGVITESGQIYGLGLEDANIIGSGHSVGILAGFCEGHISQCYSTGHATGQQNIGGLIGDLNHQGGISQCYSHATVNAESFGGGLLGYSWSMVSLAHCYSTGKVDVYTAVSETFRNGLSGGFLQHPIACFWDIETSGIVSSTDVTGLSTTQMQDINTYIEQGWSFVDSNSPSGIWMMPQEQGYPVLSLFQGISPVVQNPCLDTTTGSANPIMNASGILEANWNSFAITSLTHNQPSHITDEPAQPQRIITIDGNIHVLDVNEILGVDIVNLGICQAFDQNGDIVSILNGVSPFELAYDRRPLNPDRLQFQLQLLLAPGQSTPTSISQMDFYVHAFTAEHCVTVTIPFEVMNDWIELAPGFKVKIEQALSMDGICQFKISEEIAGTNISTGSMTILGSMDPAYLYPTDPQNLDYIYDRMMLDSEGNTATGGGSNQTQSTSNNGKRIVTVTGNWTACSGIVSLKYKVAVHPYKVTVPLSLTNIGSVAF